MRIAICGTHGTGKTTLARALSERLGVPMIEEVARKVIRNAGFQNTREYIEKAGKEQLESIQRNILSRQIATEIMTCGSSNGDFVSDRSVFDAVAYTKAYGVTGYVLHEMIGEAVTHALNTYDLLVYVPPVIGLEDDGFRDTSESLRLDVDLYLKKYIEAYELLGGMVLNIESETLDERVDEVSAALKGLKLCHDAV